LTEDVSLSILSDLPASGLARAATVIPRQRVTGGRRLAWPGSSTFPGAAPPAVVGHADAIENPAIVAKRGGTTWSGFPGERDFS
jgi:hypothetical protein